MSFLLIDKPKNMTSHDVIYKVRKVSNVKKVGHAGTLDPNATGLLVVGVGRESTKKLHTMTTGFPKTYEAEITLGETRDTLDTEGQVTSQNSEVVPDLPTVEKVVKLFLGKQKQVPPIHSAIKIGGKKAYEIARKGKEVNLEPREVEVKKIAILNYEYPKLSLEVEVSAGTYIRSLARDIGERLGTGAYLSNLRRTKVGKFDVEKSVSLGDLNAENWEDLSFEYNHE